MAATSLRRIRQPIRGRPLHKLLWKRLHVPRGIVHPLLSAAKTAANPGQVRVRRKLAVELASQPYMAVTHLGRVPEDKGFLLVPPDVLPGTAEAVAQCKSIYDEKSGDADRTKLVFNPRKQFLLALLAGADFCAYPDLIHFMVSRPILERATAYLGVVPVLAGAALWWSPENDTTQRSQLFHFDGEDDRQLKLVMNVFDTTEENGPFTLIPADASRRLESPDPMRSRMTDERVDADCGRENRVQLVGPAGSAAFVDTSRCLHFGSRATRGDRLVLMLQFTRFQCPTESTFEFAVPPDLPGLDPDPLQRLALGLESSGSRE